MVKLILIKLKSVGKFSIKSCAYNDVKRWLRNLNYLIYFLENLAELSVSLTSELNYNNHFSQAFSESLVVMVRVSVSRLHLCKRYFMLHHGAA